MILRDRTYAAFLLAEKLEAFKNTNSIVLAVPRGGVPLGYHIANLLHLPLEIILSKKIGHPANPEFAIGAVSLECLTVDPNIKKISKEYIDRESKKIRAELESRRQIFNPDNKILNVSGKNVIIVDDGIATGRTLVACVEELKIKKAAKIIIASPVASNRAAALLTPLVDEVICLIVSRDFQSVGQFYEHFPQVADDEVRRLLAKSRISYGEGVVP